MRVIGMDTSSRRGSVALVEAGRVVAFRSYDAPGGHAERLIGVIDEAVAEVGWERDRIDRIAVGVGPGSFTGIRVGIGLAQGMGLGLGRPVLGVGSLRAMCGGVPEGLPGLRAALVDARRGDVFAAVYDPDGLERVAPTIVARLEIAGWLARAGAEVVVGEVLGEMGVLPGTLRSNETDLPHAAFVAKIGASLAIAEASAEPMYVRPADAIRPNLPRSPLSSEEPR